MIHGVLKKCFDTIKLRTRNRINLEILDSYEHILKENYHLTIKGTQA